MAKVPLKDKNFVIIAYVDEKSNGDKTLYDRYHNIIGRYFAQQDLTKDRYFNIVGRGDILTSLIK